MITLDEFQAPTREYEGNALLIAGPGAGKTRTVAAKIEFLYEVQEKPLSSMKMLTFGNDAAHELLNRLPYLKYGEQVSTLHKFGLDLLRKNGFKKKVWGPDPEKPDVDPRPKIMYGFLSSDMSLGQLTQMGYKMAQLVRDTLSAIDRFKSGKTTELAETYGPAYEFYQNYLKENNLIDFNDMLLLAIEQIKKTPIYIPYLFLDEGHDTNMLQYELFKRINCDWRWGIFDPYQMIYRWNGADERNYTRFQEDFAPQRFDLLNNWRSTPEIVGLLEKIYPRGLIAKGTGPSKVEWLQVDGPETSWEGEEWNQPQKKINPHIAQQLVARNLVNGNGDHLILARTNYQLDGIPTDTVILTPNGGKREFNPKTLHRSKGLEATTVVVLGCGDGYIPFYRSLDMEEEKNLLYVACSRTKNFLYLLYENQPTEFLKGGERLWMK
jgi:superfamily I DNA/RNA helicase